MSRAGAKPTAIKTYVVRIHTVDAKTYTLESTTPEKLIEEARAAGYMAFDAAITVDGREGETLMGRAVLPWHNIAALILVNKENVT